MFGIFEKPIFTIGYEGAVVDDVITTLKKKRVKVLIDVRQVAISRKSGFSKTALRDRLAQSKIRYMHFPGLGNPKSGREAAWRGDMAESFRIFRKNLSVPQGQTALAQVLDIANRSRACLLCFEREHALCHRNLVANEVGKKSKLVIRHLRVAK